MLELIVKQCKDARHQYEWLRSLRYPAVPRGLRLFEDEDAYEYERVPGTYPSDWRQVWRFAHQVIWSLPVHNPVTRWDRDVYADYCVQKGCDPRVMALLHGRKLTPVGTCHGDLTLGNVVMRGPGQYTFIDPGHHRGLPCRELEEAKLIQSLEGWDSVRWAAPFPLPYRDQLRRTVVHDVLLYANYVRIGHHDHPRAALDFARRRADALHVELLHRHEHRLRTTRGDLR